MSQLTDTWQKKRRSVESPDVSPKRKKYKRASPEKKRDKGKSRNVTEGEFKVIKASLVVSVPPVFASKSKSGVEEMLDSMVMRYVPAFRGVVLSHSNLDFISDKALIKADCPFLVCKVAFDSTVWCPQVGMKLAGKVNLCSPDHISLLVHRTFNASIPRHHIPSDIWEFEYGPAENDPEFGPNAQGDDASPINTAQHSSTDHGGRWVHKLTGKEIGYANALVEFTAIGLTVANEMLSVLGSLQPDPFSPEHAPAQITATISSQIDSSTDNRIQSAMDMEIQREEEEEEDSLHILRRRAENDGEAVDLSRRDAEKPIDAETSLQTKYIGHPSAPQKKQKKRKKRAETVSDDK